MALVKDLRQHRLSGSHVTWKKTYMAAPRPDRGKVVQLATAEMPDVMLPDKGDGQKAVGLSSLPYDLESMWREVPAMICGLWIS
ncbi:MAG: hypothetical protein R2758_02735 [Bacteroidales bacterium]